MLTDFVRKRVSEADVEDVVQTVLVEALASESIPEDPAEMRRWLVGVARHKVADVHRKGGRERPAELLDVETGPPPVEEQELVRWAEEQAKATKDGTATLRWMAREGEGDKLEHIAAEEKLPAATVRQRVSRMRRWMKQRWIAELAAAAAVLAVALFLIVKWFAPAPTPPIVEEKRTPSPGPGPNPTLAPSGLAPSPLERAAGVRRAALELCTALPASSATPDAAKAAQRCVDGLDEAKRLDPAGDATEEVRQARERAAKLLAPAPTPSAVPSTTATPLNELNPKNNGNSPSSEPPFVPSARPTVKPTGTTTSTAYPGFEKGPSKSSITPSTGKPQGKSLVAPD
ncbi:MAG: sigma-70 family RNA polymerase sigma factor [Polyangiaceae bacterium]